MNLADDAQVLAGTIWGEARGDTEIDRKGVAAVVMNRVAAAKRRLAITGKNHPLFGDGTVRDACLRPWQFSCWNHNDPNRAKILALDCPHPDPLLADCIAIAVAALDGTLTDPTNGATYYKETSLPWPHAWGAEVKPLAVLGRQSFYAIT